MAALIFTFLALVFGALGGFALGAGMGVLAVAPLGCAGICAHVSYLIFKGEF